MELGWSGYSSPIKLCIEYLEYIPIHTFSDISSYRKSCWARKIRSISGRSLQILECGYTQITIHPNHHPWLSMNEPFNVLQALLISKRTLFLNSVRNESINSVNYRERVKHESNTIKMINYERKKYILWANVSVHQPLLLKIIVIIIGFIGNKLEFDKHWV